MKMTFDLPEDLVRELKLRAVREGRKLKDTAALILRAGLAAESTSMAHTYPRLVADKKTGLPVIQCRRAMQPGEELTPDRAAEILATQEANWTDDSWYPPKSKL